jgi:hypothetical protein
MGTVRLVDDRSADTKRQNDWQKDRHISHGNAFSLEIAWRHLPRGRCFDE